MVFEEKLIRRILERIKDIELAMFESPPKTMEDFQSRWARHNELLMLVQQLTEEAKGLEKD